MTPALAAITDDEIARWRERMPRLFARSARDRWAAWAGWAVFLAVLAVGLWRLDTSPARIISGLSRLGLLVGLMFPPSSGGQWGEVFYALLQTLAMAFIGSFVAAVIAVPLGFLGARNIAPVPFLRFGLRRIYDVLRGVDVVIWALLFISAVGLGPFAGILAIVIGDVGTLAKIFAEAVENVDPRPAEAVRATGAGSLETVRLAVVPQVLPIFLGNFLYFFEVNVRSAAVLGLVGAEGVGFLLSERIRLNDWPEVLFILILLLATVALMDWGSRAIRARILRR